jgi:choice-of-anchor C domain-containing protein
MLFAKLKSMALLCTVAAVAIGAGGFAYQAQTEKGNSNPTAAMQDLARPAPAPDELKVGGNRQEAKKAEAHPNDEPQQTNPDLPRDAAKRIKEFEAEVEAIQKKALAEIEAQRDKLIADLQALQETYTKAGKLDEAVAIRDRIKPIKTAGEKAQALRVAAEERAQNLLVNGSFEEGPEIPDDGIHNFEPEKGSTAIRGWVVTGMFVSPIHPAYWRPAHGKRSFALSWKPEEARGGGIRQDFKTRKGQKYRVSFWLAGDPLGDPPEKKLQVSAAGKSAEFSFDNTGKTRTDMGWVRKSWEFTAEADQTTLEFSCLTNSIFGVAIDDVIVVAVKE